MSEFRFNFINSVLVIKLCFYCALHKSVISNVYGRDSDTNIDDSRTTESTLSSSMNSSIEEGISENIEQVSSNETLGNELTLDQQEVMETLREKGLYYDLNTIMEDINKHRLKTGIVDLMSVHNRSEWIYRMRQNYQSRDQIKKKKRMIFINIETIYSSKREMITKAVARQLRGKQMTSPPKFMADIRVILGPGVARKLFYSLTKYSTSRHVQQVLPTQPVVLERYWLHHAAFTISKFYNETELPPRGHPVYRWPSDLLAPDVVFFVNATKHLGPTTGFDQPFTPFTERLIQVYRRVEGVRVVELSPSKNYLTVVKQIISYIMEHFRDHPDINLPSLESARGNRQRHNAKR